MDKQRRIPKGVPRDAVERVMTESFGTERCTRFVYFVGDCCVATVTYQVSGAVALEQHFDDQRRRHGVTRYEFEDGRLKFRAAYVHGLQHGLQQQWDQEGRLLCTTRFDRGTGVDLWFDAGATGDWRLAEEREYVCGMRHGIERWWSGEAVREEQMLFEDQKHGIERMWNARGRLRRGWPRYFVRDLQVTRREYERARKVDATLPVRRGADDLPERRFPVVRATGGKAVWRRR